MRYLILFFLTFIIAISNSQIPTSIDYAGNSNSGNHLISTYDFVNVHANITNNSKYDIKAGQEILFSPNTNISNFGNAGYFYGRIEASELNVVSFHSSGWSGVSKYDKLELGVELPSNIQNQIDAFLNGANGLNPYDPSQVKVEAVFNNGGIYKRYGFYYNDFNVQNNEWKEQSTNYKMRIRFAPPKTNTWGVSIKLFINGVSIASVFHTFNVINSDNPGHLKMANGNLLKLQHENGDLFFGIGQNIGYAIPKHESNCDPNTYDCLTPQAFIEQRSYISDLANNSGNFVRIRMDALNGLAEWGYKKQTISDPLDNIKPLSSFLNNYNDNQRYLWEMDNVFKLMENRGIYAMFSIFPDQNFALDNVYDPNHTITWNKNPYNTITGNNLVGCKTFFSNPSSIGTYKKWLFYLAARYGYSTSMGIWEMINETSGVANSLAEPNPYDNNTTFTPIINNWVCDMKSYLEQYYPWHPTTNGNTGDNLIKDKQPACLNIWSSNSYSSFIDKPSGQYRDENYNGRWLNQKYYFDQYRPFVYGELGMPDDINGIDEQSDASFHHTIWATTMMSGISNGLYWNDWAQSGSRNHRYNFNALSSFVKKIDFTQRLVPEHEKDNGVNILHGREIFTWYMRNNAKNYIVGWAKNNSANWTQDYPYFTSLLQNTIVSNYNYNNSINLQYTCFTTNQNPFITIKNILPLTNYKYKIYDTYNNANEIEIDTKLSSVTGTLRFRRRMDWYINSPFYPDYAFIIQPTSSWKINEHGNYEIKDTVYVNTIDSVKLSSNFIKANSNYKFDWLGLKKQEHNDSVAYVKYEQEGMYHVLMEAEDLQNDTIINHHFIIIVSDKPIHSAIEAITLYPIPANNYFTILYNQDIIKKPVIEMIDLLGKKVNVEQINSNTINTTNLANGIYLISVSKKTPIFKNNSSFFLFKKRRVVCFSFNVSNWVDLFL